MKYFGKYAPFVPVLFVCLVMLLPLIAIADTPTGGTGSDFPTGGTGSGNTVTSGDTTGSAYSLKNPLGDSTNTFSKLLEKLLNAAIAIGIPIAVLFIVWAGFRFVLARGNAAELEKARANFLWTIIGIGIFLGASLIAKVLENTVAALNS